MNPRSPKAGPEGAVEIELNSPMSRAAILGISNMKSRRCVSGVLVGIVVMAVAMATVSVVSEFWHKNFDQIPVITGSFIQKFAQENLPIKATLSRGYKFYHEGFIHDVQGLWFLNKNVFDKQLCLCFDCSDLSLSLSGFSVIFRGVRLRLVPSIIGSRVLAFFLLHFTRSEKPLKDSRLCRALPLF